MTPTADQLTAFQTNSGFVPSACAYLVFAVLFGVLLLWGAWAMRTAYVGWAECQLSPRQFLGVVIRFVSMYLVLTYFLLS